MIALYGAMSGTYSCTTANNYGRVKGEMFLLIIIKKIINFIVFLQKIVLSLQNLQKYLLQESALKSFDECVHDFR